MLSIKRRESFGHFRDDFPFGGGDAGRGWPGWGELRPLLLRSAGVVGLAGTIIAVISSDVLFMDVGRPARAGPEVAMVRPQSIDEALMPAAPALPPPTFSFSADDPFAPPPGVLTQRPAGRAPAETRIGAADQPRREAPQADSLRPGPAAGSVVSADAVSGADSPALPSRIAEPAEMRIALAEDLAVDPHEPAEIPTEAAAPPAPESDSPTADSGAPSINPPAGAEERLALAADPPTGALPRAQPMADAAPVDPASAADAATSPLWAEEASECPRDWVAPEAEGEIDSADCQALAALLPTLSPDDQAALDEAATEHAVEIGAFLPRVPMPRPNPPPRTRVRKSRDSSWPSQAPPNCGDKHAYWRFVDRKAGTKEWYCK